MSRYDEDGRELVINAPHCISCGQQRPAGSGPCTCLITGNGKRSPKNMDDRELRASMLDHQAEMTRRQGAADDDDDEGSDDALPDSNERNEGTDDHGFDGMRPQQTGRGVRAGSPPERDDWQSPVIGVPLSDEEADEMAAEQAARLGFRPAPSDGPPMVRGRSVYDQPTDYSRGQDTRQTGRPGFTYGKGPNPRSGTNLQYTTNEDGEDILGQLPITEILANEARARMVANEAEKEQRRRNRRPY